jgi:hypothetical protein
VAASTAVGEHEPDGGEHDDRDHDRKSQTP